MNVWLLTIFLSALNLITALLHALGCYLLACQHRNGLQTSQQLFLINLSISEGFFNFLKFLTNNHFGVHTKCSSLRTFQHYTKTVRGYGFATVYFSTMIYLTVDKLFDILLNIRFHLYWKELRTRRLLIGTWCLSLTSAVCASIAYYYTGFYVHETLDLYVYPTFNIVFLLVAILTYAFIFHKYKQTRLPPVPFPTSDITRRESGFKVFQRSRFYIPVLLIGTYTVFMFIPSFVQTVHVAMGNKHNYDVIINNVLRILWSVSYLADAIIYIFLKKSVRRLLHVKFVCCFVTRSSRRVSPVATITNQRSL